MEKLICVISKEKCDRNLENLTVLDIKYFIMCYMLD